MNERTVTELRAYLKKAKRDPVPEFDVFLKEVETFGKLRLEAEDGFMRNRHLAKSKRHALPLDWFDIARILNPDKQTPEISLVTEVVNLCLSEVEAIVQDLRKVLIRQREKVSLGLVQQVDSQCLLWLSKQPGRDSVEKAGARQRILAIVRRENYNTLENRVFKDVVIRIQNPCADYLKRNEPTFKEWDIVKRVRRLFVLCGEALRNPVMEDVGDIQELPLPNYVLRQEWRYAKVWKAYCRIIRHAGIAERLWLRRQALSDTLYKLRTAAPKHISTRAKYHCPIWINYVDGKNDLLDNPFYENEEDQTDTPAYVNDVATDKDVVIDLTGCQPCRDLLIYGRHENAKPYLQNYKKPSIEDLDGDFHYFLRDILKARDRDKLRDYFEQLHALAKGENWFILVPDDWDAQWQEVVIKSVPLPRNRVFLLWRSVAAVIGCTDKLVTSREGDTIAVIDIQQGGIVGMSKLSLASGERGEGLIPQRKSHDRHKEFYFHFTLAPSGKASQRKAILSGMTDEYTLFYSDFAKLSAFAGDAQHVVFVNSLCHGLKKLPQDWLVAHGRLLERGTRRFIALRDAGKIAYYDELEALSLIVQTEDERVVARTLVEANEKFSGGREDNREIPSAAAVLALETHVDFLLCMGESLPDAPLKLLRHKLTAQSEDKQFLDVRASITPGQGMAIVTVTSPKWREPVILNFDDMEATILTMASIEEIMERSFPPDPLEVKADFGFWQYVRPHVEKYMSGLRLPDGRWFAKAVKAHPHHSVPLERLRRKNVFGNDRNATLPTHQTSNDLFEFSDRFDFKRLFQKLAEDYVTYKGHPQQEEVIQLIAWSYQTNYPAFKVIVKDTLNRYVAYAKGQVVPPLNQEFTLLANLCSSRQDLTRCLSAIQIRISNENKVQWDFRLLYNLLQFHPTIIKDANLHEANRCWDFVQYFPYWFEKYNDTCTHGFILKSLLYFLRCRLFDGKVFLTEARDREHYRIIANCLESSVHPVQTKLCQEVIKYLNNKGTIDGLLSVD